MIAQLDCVRVSYHCFAVLLSSKSSSPPPSIHTNSACELSLLPRIASLNAVTSARWDICNLAWNSGDFGSNFIFFFCLTKPLSLFSHPNHFFQQYHKPNWRKCPHCSRTFSYSNIADWGQIPQFLTVLTLLAAQASVFVEIVFFWKHQNWHHPDNATVLCVSTALLRALDHRQLHIIR